MASAKQVVGNPTPRIEGELKVSGKAVYAADVTLPGMLWGKLVRSPIASGKIKRIDVSKALALRGVHAVVTGEDCTGLKIGRRLYDMPILDPVETMKPGARLIHPDVANYKGLPKPLKEPSNDFIYITWGRGDIESGFRQADIIVENTFTTSAVHQSYIEPHSCVVKAAADD